MARKSTRRKPPKTQVRRSRTKPVTLSNAYWDITHRPLQCLVFLLPMITAYEVGMIVVHRRLPEDEWPALAAQQILKWFFSLFGASGYYLPGGALIAVLLAWHLACRHPWRVSFRPLLVMAGESVLLAVPLLMLNRWLPALRSIVHLSTADASVGRIDDLLLSVGAGLYEELVFRLIIISLLMLVLKDILRIREVWGVATAVVLSSLMFAAHHYAPIGADQWSLAEFVFRTAAGAYLAAVFVMRGFGLAVGCHVIYDVIAFVT